MRGKSHGRTSLPSAALPASGSRGRPISRTSQPGGSPALIFFKIRPTRAKSICSHGLVARFSHTMAHSTVAIPIGGHRCEPHRHLPLQKMSIKRGRRSLLRCCLLFYVGVKDRVPSAVLHLPDRRGVVVARGVLPVR